jgi:hypothetical protein
MSPAAPSVSALLRMTDDLLLRVARQLELSREREATAARERVRPERSEPKAENPHPPLP